MLFQPPRNSSLINYTFISKKERKEGTGFFPRRMCVCACVCARVRACSVVSDSLPYPWNFPDKNTGVGCHFFLQGILPAQGSNLSLLSLLLWQVDSLPVGHLGSPEWYIEPIYGKYFCHCSCWRTPAKYIDSISLNELNNCGFFFKWEGFVACQVSNCVFHYLKTLWV